MCSSCPRRRNMPAIPRIPRARPPIRSPTPAVTACRAAGSVEASTGRSAVGTAESDEETAPEAGGGVVEESCAPAATAAGAEALAPSGWADVADVLAGSFCFVFSSFTVFERGVRDALGIDDEVDVEDVVACGAAEAEAAAEAEGDVPLGAIGARAGMSGIGTGVACGAGAASVEDGGCGVGAPENASLDS